MQKHRSYPSRQLFATKPELAGYFNKTTYGVLRNPYTNQLFSQSDQEKLLAQCKKCNLSIYSPEILSAESSVSYETINQLAVLALACSVDYDLIHNYPIATPALNQFAQYYKTLSQSEKNYLDSLVIEWNKPTDNGRLNLTRTKLGDMIDWLAQGEICLHLAAVYFWIAIRTINKDFVIQTYGKAIPEPINHTSNYWNGMIPNPPIANPSEVTPLLLETIQAVRKIEMSSDAAKIVLNINQKTKETAPITNSSHSVIKPQIQHSIPQSQPKPEKRTLEVKSQLPNSVPKTEISTQNNAKHAQHQENVQQPVPLNNHPQNLSPNQLKKINKATTTLFFSIKKCEAHAQKLGNKDRKKSLNALVSSWDNQFRTLSPIENGKIARNSNILSTNMDWHTSFKTHISQKNLKEFEAHENKFLYGLTMLGNMAFALTGIGAFILIIRALLTKEWKINSVFIGAQTETETLIDETLMAAARLNETIYNLKM